MTTCLITMALLCRIYPFSCLDWPVRYVKGQRQIKRHLGARRPIGNPTHRHHIVLSLIFGTCPQFSCSFMPSGYSICGSDLRMSFNHTGLHISSSVELFNWPLSILITIRASFVKWANICVESLYVKVMNHFLNKMYSYWQ